MGLSYHLTQTGDHARLSFRWDCPICRVERLVGPALQPARPVGRVAAVGIATLLASTPLVTGIAQADGPYAPLPGMVEVPEDPNPEPPPDDSPPPPAPPLESGSPTAPAPPPPPPAPPPPAPAPAASPAPVAAPMPAPAQEPPPAMPAPAATPAPAVKPAPPPAKPAPPPPPRPHSTPKPDPASPASVPVPGSKAATNRTTASSSRDIDRAESTERTRAEPILVPAASSRQTVSSGHSYIVEAGDSLWSIAQRLAGPRGSDARIASLVSQLWHLNASAIHTGDPSLILTGTELRLPA